MKTDVRLTLLTWMLIVIMVCMSCQIIWLTANVEKMAEASNVPKVTMQEAIKGEWEDVRDKLGEL